MPRRAKFYIFSVIAAGTMILGGAASLWTCPSPLRFFTCLALAILGSTFKVKLPGMEGCISPSFVPLLFAAGTMSWPETAVMAAVAGLVQTLWKAQRTPQLVQVLFNTATLAIAMGGAHALSHAVAPRQVLVQLGAAVTVFEILNTLTVSVVICLVSGSSLSSMWRNCHLWAFPFHLAGAVLAAVWIQSDVAMSVSITLLGAITLYLFSVFYKELVKRAAPAEA
jgi:hypothetical protein